MDQQRRQLLNAGLVAGVGALMAGGARAEDAGTLAAPPPGKPGDFNFLTGEWRIKNRRLPKPGAAWDLFDGEATVVGILNGVGSVEELRIPARNFSGMGLRLLDLEKGVWFDYWVNGKSGALGGGGGVPGGFRDGAGVFASEDVDDGHPIIVKGVWDRITPTSCRWWQATSRDGGRTWEENWLMDWTRA